MANIGPQRTAVAGSGVASPAGLIVIVVLDASAPGGTIRCTPASGPPDAPTSSPPSAPIVPCSRSVSTLGAPPFVAPPSHPSSSSAPATALAQPNVVLFIPLIASTRSMVILLLSGRRTSKHLASLHLVDGIPLSNARAEEKTGTRAEPVADRARIHAVGARARPRGPAVFAARAGHVCPCCARDREACCVGVGVSVRVADPRSPTA